MKRFCWLIAAVLTALIATGYFFLRIDPNALPNWRSGNDAIDVTIAPVRRGSALMTVRLTGELGPAREATIISRLAGKVTDVRFNIGDSVPAGAIVANIHSASVAERMAELQAAIVAARKDFGLKAKIVAEAEKRLTKSREWHQQDLIARRDVAQAETVMQTARAQAELARANLAQQEAMLAQLHTLQGLARLSAPIGGVVTGRWAEPGATIAASAPILTIANLQTLKMIAKMSGVHANDVRKGLKAEISSLEAPGAISQGTVVRADSLKATEGPISEIEIHVDNSEGIFRPGMAATAVISLEQQEEILLIPRSAVVSARGQDYVYKLAGNRALRQEIGLGKQRGEEIEIKTGLKEGDAVITDQLSLLKAGSLVRVSATKAPPSIGK
ncbi:MAG TPA: efflux RND transporter periplasmic adaptor subunit [Candidatus Binatia bacterium]|jgi:RND family efflux transporter MFP subunit|nr:efflux RND transporter periplasmic adaptor subunit [Candidatus Binatia bacterium]